MKEYCGVFGACAEDFSYSIASVIYPGLMAIQHRGQIFSGISTTSCDRKLTTYKNFCFVSKFLNPKKLR